MLAFLTVACTTTEKSVVPKLEDSSGEKIETTFIDITRISDGKYYTGIAFEKITEVSKIKYSTSEAENISEKVYAYNKKTTELKFSTDIKIPDDEYCVHIVGVPEKPARLVLNNIKDKDPLIMINGKIAKNGSEYKYISATKSIEFISPLDLDSDSYLIFCNTTDGGTLSIGNKMDKYMKSYETEMSKFVSDS